MLDVVASLTLTSILRVSHQVGRRRLSSFPHNFHTFGIRFQTRALHSSLPEDNHVPFRKQLKDEEKRRRAAKRAQAGNPGTHALDSQTAGATKAAKRNNWDLTVGIEIHAQLNCDRKLFSTSRSSTDAVPNSNVSLFDLAYPGSQPIFQKEALIPALRAAIALNCDIEHESSFDRKHYFYQDQPAGYQITQYYSPFARNGHVTLSDIDGLDAGNSHITIEIQQIQMEQDTAKSIVDPPSFALLDFNRVGHPLIEIITRPHMHSPWAAAACVKKISSILQAVNACTTGMELGGLRADVNISVKPKGTTSLGQRVEIKNLSSFQAVEDAVSAERDRQIDILESGGIVEGETRGWTLGGSETQKLRGKEGEVDYRYMPDPDVAPVIIAKSLINHVKDNLPDLPDDTIRDLVSNSRLTLKDAKTLAVLDNGERLDYFDQVNASLKQLQAQKTKVVGKREDSPAKLQDFEASPDPVVKGGGEETQHMDRIVANWVLHELGGLLNTAAVPFSTNKVDPHSLACLCHRLAEGLITRPQAKDILFIIFNGDNRDVDQIIRDDLPSSQDEPEDFKAVAEQLIKENPDKVRDIKEKGKMGKLQWFMGQMMQLSEGNLQPAKANALLREILELNK